jgi:hypothetical protein
MNILVLSVYLLILNPPDTPLQIPVMPPILLFLPLPALIVLIDFIGFVVTRKRIVAEPFIILAEAGSLFILPFMYAGFELGNECCRDEIDTAAFSPAHRLTIITVITLSLSAYLFSKFRKHIAPPIIEVLINVFILIGIVLNIFIGIHTKEWLYTGLGNVPVILLGILMLAKNQQKFITETKSHPKENRNSVEAIAWKILSMETWIKFPVLLILCLPVLITITIFLLLFGQKPDSIVRAFTETYRHGFSQWDYKCDNITCGGHYLCSVAANGHARIVRPKRLGIRNGHTIICNRQLLISNAFEDIILERCPLLHRMIRNQYNKVGNLIHRYYGLFNNKYVSDFVYVLMKPLEWFFIAALYTLDKHPENRIEKQYLQHSDRLTIEGLCSSKSKNTGLK